MANWELAVQRARFVPDRPTEMNPVKPLLPRVIKVLPLENYQLLLQFRTNQSNGFDVRPYLDYPAFKRLTAAGLFQSACTARDGGLGRDAGLGSGNLVPAGCARNFF